MELKQMGVSINKQVQIDFKEVVEQKHKRIRGVYGSEIENAMKVYLTLQGSTLYQNDPSVQAVLNQNINKTSTHTHNSSKNVNVAKDVVDKIEDIEDRFDRLEKKLDKIVNAKPSNKTGSLAAFKKQFQAEYGHHTQVSKRDLIRFVTANEGVCDRRSIQSRIEYLVAHEVLKPFAHNVYNVNF